MEEEVEEEGNPVGKEIGALHREEEGSQAEDLENEFMLKPDTVSSTTEGAEVSQESERGGEVSATSPSPPSPTTSMRRAGLGRRVGGRQVSIYSSSSEEETQETSKLRRRRRRRRPLGGQERKERQKAARIEEALAAGDRNKLGQLAASHGGLLTDQVSQWSKPLDLDTTPPQTRVRVWPQLLGLEGGEVGVTPSPEVVAGHSQYNQGKHHVLWKIDPCSPVVLDVNRSLKRFPPGIEESARPGLQDQLTRLIIRVLLARPSLHYYQGYHDVAITFLLVLGEERAFHLLERLSMSHLRSFMAPSMELTMDLLELIYPLLQRSQPALHHHLVQAELGTIFALPWLITWFGHVLPDYSDVVRLYDFFLAGPPLMPVYLAAAIVLHRSAEVMAAECEMSAIHSLLSRIPVDLPFEDLLVSCAALYEQLPPHVVEEEAKRSRKEQERRLRRPYEDKSGLEGYKRMLTQMVIFGAPVVIGWVVWRIYSSVT